VSGRKRAAVVLALLVPGLLLCLPAHAQSVGEWRNSEQLWRSTCAYCHDGRLASQLLGARLTAQAVLAAARAGPNSMPSFSASQVSDAELRALADWMSRQKKPATDDDGRSPRHAARQRSR